MKRTLPIAYLALAGAAAVLVALLTAQSCLREGDRAYLSWYRLGRFSLLEVSRVLACYEERRHEPPLSVENLYASGCLDPTTRLTASGTPLTAIPLHSNNGWVRIDEVVLRREALNGSITATDIIAVMLPDTRTPDHMLLLTAEGSVVHLSRDEWLQHRDEWTRRTGGAALWGVAEKGP